MSKGAGDLARWSRMLADSDAGQRRAAATGLMHAGEGAAAAALALVRAVSDPDEIVAAQACEALENLGPPCPSDVLELARLLQSEQVDCAYWAATLLGRLRAQAEPAVAALADVVAASAALNVQERAAWALGEIGPAAHSARDVLARATQSGSPRLARLAQESLRKLVPPGE